MRYKNDNDTLSVGRWGLNRTLCLFLFFQDRISIFQVEKKHATNKHLWANKNVSLTHFCKFAFCQTFTVKNSIKRRNKIEAKSTQHNIFYLNATPSGK